MNELSLIPGVADFLEMFGKDPEVSVLRNKVLSGDWRHNRTQPSPGVTVDAWYGGLAEEEALYLEREVNLVEGKTHVRGVKATRGDGIMEMEKLPELLAAYAAGLLERSGGFTLPIHSSPQVQTPLWSFHFFLMEWMPRVIANYHWSGTYGEDGLQLIGKDNESSGYYLRLDHKPDEPLHEGTLAYMGHEVDGDKLINFPVTQRFLDTALDSWRAQTSKEKGATPA